jgi:hypothetical protein
MERVWDYPRAAGARDQPPADHQDGDLYGGWITRDVIGPYKGGAGTLHW